MRIGDGTLVNFWEDWWCSSGPLITQQSLRRVRISGKNRNLRVCQLIKDGNWDCTNMNLPRQLIEAINNVPITRGSVDKPIQVPLNSLELPSKIIYDDIRHKWVSGHWIQLLWFKKHVPKFSFITWLVALDKINTSVKLRSWHINVDTKCLLCSLIMTNPGTACSLLVNTQRISWLRVLDGAALDSRLVISHGLMFLIGL